MVIWANITHYAGKGTLFESNYKEDLKILLKYCKINDSASDINLSKPLKDLILDEVNTINFKPTAKHKFTFDFRWKGGFRIAMQNLEDA